MNWFKILVWEPLLCIVYIAGLAFKGRTLLSTVYCGILWMLYGLNIPHYTFKSHFQNSKLEKFLKRTQAMAVILSRGISKDPP